LGVCGLDNSDSFLLNNKVSVKWGQLQVVNAEGLNDRMKALYEQRITSNRRHSADLAACITELPPWYKWWLNRMGQAPERAATHLIGYSNTTEYEQAAKVTSAIKKALGFKGDEE
jgi:hypothetical protein